MSAPELRRLVAAAQAEQRIPSVAAAVVRDGEIVCSDAVGIAEPGRDATPDDQYRIGSISKTFCAAAVHAAPRRGRARARRPAHRVRARERARARRSAGCSRTPPGSSASRRATSGRRSSRRRATSSSPSSPTSRTCSSRAAASTTRTSPSRSSARSSAASPGSRTRSTSTSGSCARSGWGGRPGARPRRCARGYFVDPYDERLRPESDMEPGATQSVGGLWSTVGDLARWAAFLADPDPAVLKPETVDEMASVQVMVDPGWKVGLRARAPAHARRRPDLRGPRRRDAGLPRGARCSCAPRRRARPCSRTRARARSRRRSR